MEKELEDAGIKLSSVGTDILGRSGRAMLAALIDGERDVRVLAEMAKARMRPKIPQLVEALTGNFAEHHAFLCRMHPDRIDQLSAAVGELTADRRGDAPFCPPAERLVTIPGRPDGRRGPHRRDRRGYGAVPHGWHLASWAGVCPATTNPPANPARPATATTG